MFSFHVQNRVTGANRDANGNVHPSVNARVTGEGRMGSKRNE